MKFFSPTSELKELLLLQHIEKKPDTTQKEIAKVIEGATSMVNVYIDNLEKENYMSREYKSAKLVYYNITPEGIKRKKFLSIAYLHELLKLYRLAEENIENFLLNLEDKGYKNILFYGAGDVAETILSVIRDRDIYKVSIVGLIDDDIDLYHKKLMGHKIISRDEMGEYEHDAVVITSYGYEDEITKRLEEIDYPKDRMVTFFGE